MSIVPSTTIKSDVGSATGGVITFQGGTGATVNQSGSTFTIGAAPSIGGIVTGGTTGSVLFVGPGSTIAQDNANLFWNDSTDALAIGQNVTALTVNSLAVTAKLTVDMETDLVGMLNHIHNNSATIAPNYILAKSRGTHASPTIVSTSETLGIVAGYGYTGNSGVGYQKAAQIRFETPSAGTFSTTSMPGQISFYTTPDTTITPALAATIGQDKSFTLYGELQNWLGSQMIIRDVLARDIITATGVLLTISNLNLLVEEDIQVDGSIEVMSTVDLNMVTGEQLRILPDNTTLVGSCIALSISSILTFDTASDSFQFAKANGEFKFTVTPTLGIPPVFFQFIPTIRATTNNITLSGTAVFYNQMSVIADGVVLTYGNSFPSFFDSPQFSIANSGSFTSFNYNSMRSEVVVNTGVAMTQRSGWRFANATGAGTIATQIGYFCAALTKGGTANNPILLNAPDTADASGSMIDGNITFFATTGSYGGGSRVLFIHNATTDPSTNPTAGGILYTSSGALKYRGSGGTVTTLAGA